VGQRVVRLCLFIHKLVWCRVQQYSKSRTQSGGLHTGGGKLWPFASTGAFRVTKCAWRSRGSSVSLVTRLQAGRPRLQNYFAAHSASCPAGTGGFYPWVKCPGRKADHLLHLAPRVRMHGAIPPLSHTDV
jgi:hypothetical protein